MRPPGEGKSRLAPALAPAARAMLVERMFRHVLHVATQVTAQCYVVSRSAFLRDLAVAAGAHAVAETGIGLNKALAEASALVDPDLPVLALSADLPLLTASDLAALGGADVIAATDRAGTGTNALLLRRPGLIDYAFGEGSLARHRANAVAAGLS
ncbi:MAG: 2-phospho-L-lactate guanylyltransferase, partial [Sphingomonadales bacterium]|nr:2-phospho-L-lactate guanylyltransferase [Sphingomonadales bacterium]